MRYEFCTLFDKVYLTRGLALHQSLIDCRIDFRLWVLCLDTETYEILDKLKLDRVQLITLADLEDKELLRVRSERTSREYYWTLSSSLPLYLLNKYKIKSVAYLDADLYFYDSPEPVYREMGQDSVLIIPHRIVPWKNVKEEKVGRFNVGMLIFRNDQRAKKALKWWRNQCIEWCYYRVEDGKMGDQKYLDEFPERFSGVHVLKHKGAGVAHWNISQYSITSDGEKIYIDSQPLIFVHYQGARIYRSAPPLPDGPRDYYNEPSVHRDWLYKKYFQVVRAKAKSVEQLVPGFNFGFAPRPLDPKSIISQILLTLTYGKNLFDTKFHWL